MDRHAGGEDGAKQRMPPRRHNVVNGHRLERGVRPADREEGARAGSGSDREGSGIEWTECKKRSDVWKYSQSGAKYITPLCDCIKTIFPLTFCTATPRPRD